MRTDRQVCAPQEQCLGLKRPVVRQLGVENSAAFACICLKKQE
jgi:hypothetical protein